VKQSTSHILMVRPAAFGFNDQTAASNHFQQPETANHQPNILMQAQIEFDEAVKTLRANGITVHVAQDTCPPVKPDAVFPNNWVSFSENGTVFIYPMLTENRSAEVQLNIIENLKRKFNIHRIIDLRENSANQSLEGTGSMVFDHLNRIAYASISARTSPELFSAFCKLINYRPVSFQSANLLGNPIYHTNVMMCIGEKFAVICLESISNHHQREEVEKTLLDTGHEIIEISNNQVTEFAGNMICIENKNGELLILMSERARRALNQKQSARLNVHGRIISVHIPTIETIGGGSARCMVAEIFCPPL